MAVGITYHLYILSWKQKWGIQMVLWTGVQERGGRCVSLRGRQLPEGGGKVSDATEVRSDEDRLETNVW